MSFIAKDIDIRYLTKKDEDKSKKLIINGLKEYFDKYDENLNPDLKNLFKTYTNNNNLLIIGLYKEELISTAGLKEENKNIARIVRMSVKKEFRQKGIASLMIDELEKIAKNKGYKKIVLETTKSWKKVINFYKKNNYIEYEKEDSNIHFIKKI